jgi:hypothetical protein
MKKASLYYAMYQGLKIDTGYPKIGVEGCALNKCLPKVELRGCSLALPTKARIFC